MSSAAAHATSMRFRISCQVKRLSRIGREIEAAASTTHWETNLALSDNLRELLNISHAIAWHGADTAGKKADEPGLISALLNDTVQIGLEIELQALYGRGANVRIDSIFTHKTPTVEPLGKSPVEIADLLLIRQHFPTKGGKPQGRALLLQAKKNAAPNSGTFAVGKPTFQFELYRDWPSFEGATRLSRFADPATALPWDFKLKNPNGRFGEYLAVFDEKAHAFVAPALVGAVTPAFAASVYPQTAGKKTTWSNGPLALPPVVQPIPVACPTDFAETLEQMFRGTAGVAFVPGLMSVNDHWSLFINTMLLEASKSDYTFVSRRTNVNSDTPRGATICAFMAAQPLIKLAVMREVERYSALLVDGLPDFDSEPHFFRQACQRSKVIADLHYLTDQLRVELRGAENDWSDHGVLGGDREPPQANGIQRDEDRDGHVPILSISTSGPEPLWRDDSGR